MGLNVFQPFSFPVELSSAFKIANILKAGCVAERSSNGRGLKIHLRGCFPWYLSGLHCGCSLGELAPKAHCQYEVPRVSWGPRVFCT